MTGSAGSTYFAVQFEQPPVQNSGSTVDIMGSNDTFLPTVPGTYQIQYGIYANAARQPQNGGTGSSSVALLLSTGNFIPGSKVGVQSSTYQTNDLIFTFDGATTVQLVNVDVQPHTLFIGLPGTATGPTGPIGAYIDFKLLTLP